MELAMADEQTCGHLHQLVPLVDIFASFMYRLSATFTAVDFAKERQKKRERERRKERKKDGEKEGRKERKDGRKEGRREGREERKGENADFEEETYFSWNKWYLFLSLLCSSLSRGTWQSQEPWLNKRSSWKGTPSSCEYPTDWSSSMTTKP